MTLESTLFDLFDKCLSFSFFCTTPGRVRGASPNEVWPSSRDLTRPITNSQTSTHRKCCEDSCVIVIPIFLWTPWCNRKSPRFRSGPCSTGTGLYSPDTSSSRISHHTSKSYRECVWPPFEQFSGVAEYTEPIGTGFSRLHKLRSGLLLLPNKWYPCCTTLWSINYQGTNYREQLYLYESKLTRSLTYSLKVQAKMIWRGLARKRARKSLE